MRVSGTRGAERGFSLVELLVVILVIGILAAIAIPVLMRQREKGWDAAVASDLRNAAIAQDAFLTEGGPGNYATTVEQLVSLGFRPSAESHYFGGVFAMGVNSWGAHYCLTAQSRSGNYLGYSSDHGPVSKPQGIDATTCS
jgi:type IV pilus assembly protein PilA